VRSHKIVAVTAAVGALVFVSWSATPDAQQAPRGRGQQAAPPATATPAAPAAPAQGGQTAGRGARGRGANAAPPLPTPRLDDFQRTVNFGRVPGEKGYWQTPYITNMGARVMGPDGKAIPLVKPPASTSTVAPVGGGEGGGGNGRGGAPAEPFVPFQPWAAAVYNYNSKNQSQYDPEGYCFPPGGPRLMATPYPMEILQEPSSQRIIMIFEGASHTWREIYMDGRQHPTGEALNPTFLGNSIGHYDGPDKLVVDVVGFNEESWLDYFGHPHTNMLHVVEQFTRPNKQTLHYEAKIDDPGAYTKPWDVAWDVPWNANGEITEYICQQNNRFMRKLKDDLGQPVFFGKSGKE
jgi:hypothetical protein